MVPNSKKVAIKAINFKNFPRTAILHAVDVENKRFKLGNLTFKFKDDFGGISNPLFIRQNFLFLDDWEFIYVEDDKNSLETAFTELVNTVEYEMPKNGTIYYKDFFGIGFSGKYGTILEMGFQANGESTQFEFVFNFNEHLLTQYLEPINLEAEVNV